MKTRTIVEDVSGNLNRRYFAEAEDDEVKVRREANDVREAARRIVDAIRHKADDIERKFIETGVLQKPDAPKPVEAAPVSDPPVVAVQPEKKKTLRDTVKIGDVELRLYWNEKDGSKVYWVDFELWTDSPRRDEPMMSGSVKWDGCTQLRTEMFHADGVGELDGLLRAIAEARRRCALAMPWSDVAKEYP